MEAPSVLSIKLLSPFTSRLKGDPIALVWFIERHGRRPSTLPSTISGAECVVGTVAGRPLEPELGHHFLELPPRKRQLIPGAPAVEERFYDSHAMTGRWGRPMALQRQGTIGFIAANARVGIVKESSEHTVVRTGSHN